MEWSTLNDTSISFRQESGIVEKVEQNSVRGKTMAGNIGEIEAVYSAVKHYLLDITGSFHT